MFLGLRTVIYPAPDLQAARAWFTNALDTPPYFDESFYVGFNVGGYELGLDPAGEEGRGALTYWGVEDVDAALEHLIGQGAIEHRPIRDVGDGIRVATVELPGELGLFGIIENPHFEG
jgi:catechol 2,3-dioxygenase-like lactoylglutathione lyase family enzyme